MKIHFRDVQTGMVEARAVIEIEEGVFLNEVTILNIDGELVVEFPRKNFIGKNDKQHHLDIITFENEDKQVLWELQIKTAYRDWRKANKKVLVYEDKPEIETESSEPARKPYRDYPYAERKSRSFRDRHDKYDKDRKPERRFSSSRDDRPLSTDEKNKPARRSEHSDRQPRRKEFQAKTGRRNRD
jgi:hypothetical protein